MMKEKEVLIKVESLSKKFSKDLKTSLKYGLRDVLSQITGKKREESLRETEFWAVQDINFEVRRGECIGLIGHNGAGKSTLLKMINGLINPDKGKITIYGRVAALIELGAGFNPILTGRENIYNNGMVLGLTRKEIDERIQDIIEFSEVGEFIDSPLRSFSTGMKVRLGFSIAAQMDPDVLIIDEVLAVGDIGFRIKCLNRISELLSTCAVVFVSHSMPQIARVSTSVLLMDKGKKVYFGHDIGQGIKLYNSHFKKEQSSVIGTGAIFIRDHLLNGKHSKEHEIKFGEQITLKLFLDNQLNKEFFVNVVFMDANLVGVAVVSTRNQVLWRKGFQEVEIVFENNFSPGVYNINVFFLESTDKNDFNYGANIKTYGNLLAVKIDGSNHISSIPIQLKGKIELI
jgi:lipopolysaccharide transport system ATP-binding protein